MARVTSLTAVSAALLLSACGGGQPSSVEDVTEKLRGDMSEDGYQVIWLKVEQTEPGKFKAVIDRAKDGDRDTEQTMLCDVSATTMSSSHVCQTADPSIMIQAVNLLKKQYETRNIEVREFVLNRTGEGYGFTGYFVLARPGGSETLRVPCKGDQNGSDFTIDCDQSYEDRPAGPGGQT